MTHFYLSALGNKLLNNTAVELDDLIDLMMTDGRPGVATVGVALDDKRADGRVMLTADEDARKLAVNMEAPLAVMAVIDMLGQLGVNMQVPVAVMAEIDALGQWGLNMQGPVAVMAEIQQPCLLAATGGAAGHDDQPELVMEITTGRDQRQGLLTEDMM